mmetsp:Transcript_6379/g.10803  ORF Transcript_6379/g.10803 Transcript_6379/m.10803 type:complete len:263 (-) Transcript_6379:2-790(-)
MAPPSMAAALPPVPAASPPRSAAPSPAGTPQCAEEAHAERTFFDLQGNGLSTARLKEIARLRHAVRDAAEEFCAVRRQLGEVLRARRSLREQVSMQRQAECMADQAVRAAAEECHQWVSQELPATMQQLAAEQAELSADEAEALKLRQRQVAQSRHLEQLAMRCAGLEEQLRLRQKQVQAATVSRRLQEANERLEELDRLRLLIKKEREEHKREARALEVAIAALGGINATRGTRNEACLSGGQPSACAADSGRVTEVTWVD